MNKKGKILLMIGFVTVGIIVAVVFGSQKEIMPIGSALPEIKYIASSDSGYINVKRKPLMIMYFKPDCPHCEYELGVMNKKFNELFSIDIYCITTDKDFIRNHGFEKWNNLVNMKNFVFGSVNENEYKEKFGINVTPVFYFFSKDGKLFDKIIGETKFDRLLESIKKAGGAQHQ